MELLQSMQVFAKLAELGSFTKVAEAMQAGRPHVTRTIQDLEASLGVRLFQRTTRKVKLTAEGERFYERVKEILATIAETTSMFDRNRRCEGGFELTSLLHFPSAASWKALGGLPRHFPKSSLC